MNEYTVVTMAGHHLQWFADTHVIARREAEETGHKVKTVSFKREMVEEDTSEKNNNSKELLS